MKRVLITGVNSYVGNNLEKWLQQHPEQYEVDKISVRGDEWKEKDFSKYDSIVHVAGIAHRKETKENKELYYKVNRDLTIALATKAKEENVSQFIFLSSMSVYGLETGIINDETPLNPKTYYGKSKLEAEVKLLKLQDDNLNTVILRPPMIYGKDCPGNYQRLRNIALNFPIFPNIKNKRSMIYIDNLSMYIEKLIKECSSGIYLPQNKTYVSTYNMVNLICKYNNTSIRGVKLFNIFIKFFKINTVNKVFGNLTYEQKKEQMNVNFIDFEESIKLTEEKK